MKNYINLDTKVLEELKNSNYEGIKSKYAPLILNVIEANNNFPNELKDCIIDHNMIEDIMLEPDLNFLINEFGKTIYWFPKEFMFACYKLKHEFQKDFPKACDANLATKNNVYGKNYKTPDILLYFHPEFDEIRNALRELVLEFVNKLGIVANLQHYEVYASCVKSEEKYKLKLEIYVREKNDFPHIFESNPFSNPIDKGDLKEIEHYYEWLAVANKWGNEIDYMFDMQDGNEMLKYIPDFSLEFPVFKYTQGKFMRILGYDLGDKSHLAS